MLQVVHVKDEWDPVTGFQGATHAERIGVVAVHQTRWVVDKRPFNGA